MKVIWIKNNEGLTLIEVIASITILSIILSVCMNIFVFSNKTAISNNEKLVATHLAKGHLERVKVNPEYYFGDNNDYTFTNKVFTDEEYINDKYYDVKVTNKAADTSNSRLYHVIVEVMLRHSEPPISSKVEGYINYEE